MGVNVRILVLHANADLPPIDPPMTGEIKVRDYEIEKGERRLNKDMASQMETGDTPSSGQQFEGRLKAKAIVLLNR